MPFPMLVEEAKGARLTDIDGVKFDDFCLGDTGSMFGHSPKPVAKAISRQAANAASPTCCRRRTRWRSAGCCPSASACSSWQIATTATDANRFALRVARAVTGRRKILVFNGCYHGAVDETFVRLEDGKAGATVRAWPGSSAI